MQQGKLSVRGLAGDAVNGADRAKIEAVMGAQRRAGIETNVRRPRDKRVDSEQWILRRVVDDINVHAVNGMCAKRQFARCFPGIQSHAGLEPLTAFVNRGDQRNGNIKGRRGEAYNPVKFLFGLGI